MTANRPWLAGIGGGLVGGIGMGLVLQFVMGAMPVIGSLYGQPTVVAGWVAHMVHSVLFALVFVALVTRTDLRQYARTPLWTAGLGIAYGVVLTAVAGAFVMPLWLNTLTGAGLPVPLLSAPSFAGHVVYGFLLGAVYGVARGTGVTEPTVAEATEAGATDATSADVSTEMPAEMEADAKEMAADQKAAVAETESELETETAETDVEEHDAEPTSETEPGSRTEET